MTTSILTATMIIFDVPPRIQLNASMDLFFSICSNNYLAQATVLRKSIQQFHPEIPFFLFLCDQKLSTVDYLPVADEVIELENIEPGFDESGTKIQHHRVKHLPQTPGIRIFIFGKKIPARHFPGSGYQTL